MRPSSVRSLMFSPCRDSTLLSSRIRAAAACSRGPALPSQFRGRLRLIVAQGSHRVIEHFVNGMEVAALDSSWRQTFARPALEQSSVGASPVTLRSYRYSPHFHTPRRLTRNP